MMDDVAKTLYLTVRNALMKRLEEEKVEILCNTKVTELPVSEDMRYEYTLIAYNEHGKEKEMAFKTSRELREDAYLKLDTMFLRGVINWEEVQFEELPEEVKMKYQE